MTQHRVHSNETQPPAVPMTDARSAFDHHKPDINKANVRSRLLEMIIENEQKRQADIFIPSKQR